MKGIGVFKDLDEVSDVAELQLQFSIPRVFHEDSVLAEIKFCTGPSRDDSENGPVHLGKTLDIQL